MGGENVHFKCDRTSRGTLAALITLQKVLAADHLDFFDKIASDVFS
jgi:hypothetical protein